MTDRQPDLDDARLNADLASWFEGEVRQAAVDLRRAPLRPARARRAAPRSIAAPAAGAILVTILVVAGITRLPSLAPAAEPTHSAVPSASHSAPQPTATASPEPVPSIDRRHDDGIPAAIDGVRVVRPSTIARLGPADDRPFLLGGWSFDFLGLEYSCWIAPFTPPPFGPPCGTPFLSETPLTFGEGPRVLLDDWTAYVPDGPVVLRVHRHDARATGCSTDLRDECEAMAVIEGIVWAGDDLTAAAPLTPIEAVQRLAGVVGALGQATVSPVGEQWRDRPITAPPPCVPPFPRMTWSVSGSGLVYILVFPSVAAREAVDQDFTASGWRGSDGDGNSCFVITDSLFNHEWIAVDNVMVAAEVSVNGATPREVSLIEAVREALEGPE
jgi:hypothetical protein